MAKHKKRQDLAPKRSASSRLSGNRMLDDLKGVAVMAGGFVAGKYIANLVDKGTNTVSGMMGIDGTEIKTYIRPLVTVGIGLAANQLFSNQLVKKAAIGVAAYGVVDGIQKISGQKMLAGLGDAETVVPPQLPPFQYQALPQFQMPIMGADEPENITAGNDVVTDFQPVAGAEYFSLTEGADVYEAESLTAGLNDGEDLKIAA